MWAVQALAQPAPTQLSLFPDFAEVADELALEYEESQLAFLASPASALLTRQQRQDLRAIDSILEAMSGPENIELWSIQALHECDVWNDVRELAQTALLAMGWSSVSPPAERAIYLRIP